MLDFYDFMGDIWLCHSFMGTCYNSTAFVGPAQFFFTIFQRAPGQTLSLNLSATRGQCAPRDPRFPGEEPRRDHHHFRRRLRQDSSRFDQRVDRRRVDPLLVSRLSDAQERRRLASGQRHDPPERAVTGLHLEVRQGGHGGHPLHVALRRGESV